MQTVERGLISRCLGGCVELCSPGHSTPKKQNKTKKAWARLDWFQCFADQKLLDRGGTAQVILVGWVGEGFGLVAQGSRVIQPLTRLI